MLEGYHCIVYDPVATEEGQMIESLKAGGKLIHECGLSAETRGDGVFPAHPNGMQLSKDRWLLIYATRGWRCADDDMSIVYQIREHTPVGPVLNPSSTV